MHKPWGEAEPTAERVARNQSTFREANEQIAGSAQELMPTADRIPFICECPNPRCTAIARLSLADYERVRSRGDTFFAVPGHEVCEVDGEEVAKIVARETAFTLMQKLGRAGEIAHELDPRGPA